MKQHYDFSKGKRGPVVKVPRSSYRLKRIEDESDFTRDTLIGIIANRRTNSPLKLLALMLLTPAIYDRTFKNLPRDFFHTKERRSVSRAYSLGRKWI